MKTLSIIIPCYNEKHRLHSTFPKIIKSVKDIMGRTNNIEIIFIDDGSTDDTIKEIKNQANKHKFIKFKRYKNNKGKGYALRQGFKIAKNDYILFMDADLSTPLKHIRQFLKQAQENLILIGSRRTSGSNIKKHQTNMREMLGRGFTLISRIAINPEIKDFTCGFKMFPRKIGKKLFNKATINRWAFDSEILFLAKKYNYKVKQIPVTWINDRKTKVNLKKDIIKSLIDIGQILQNNIKGIYD